VCANPLATGHQPTLCGQCQQKTPYFSRCLAPFLYRAPLDQLILGFKFQQKLAWGRLLGNLLSEYIEQQPINRPDVLIPVPLHPDRLSERGFNQALELARILSQAQHVPVERQLCQRLRNTPAQSTLSRKDRRHNIRNAFAVSGNVQGLKLAIVDDVITSGSTVNELARCLKQAGANQVQVWGIARAASH